MGVDGRIQTSSYDNQQGQRIFRTDVILENFSLLEPKNQNGSTSSNNFSNQNSQSNYNQNANNFNNQSNTNNQYRNSNQKSKDPFQNNNGGIEISDDDLPF